MCVGGGEHASGRRRKGKPRERENERERERARKCMKTFNTKKRKKKKTKVLAVVGPFWRAVLHSRCHELVSRCLAE
jgi:hypothetical protein